MWPGVFVVTASEGCGNIGVVGVGVGLEVLAGVEGVRLGGVLGGFAVAIVVVVIDEGVGVGAPMLSVLAIVEVANSSSMSGLLKSHRTPCLEQFPHRGWTSSH